MLNVRRAVVAVALALVPLAIADRVCAQIEAPAWSTVEKSVVVVGYREADGTFVEWGTGFCITSNASSSEFLTDQHVVEQPASSESLRLVVLFPDSSRAVSATVIQSSANVDLAVVRVAVGHVASLHISTDLPRASERVALGGFPYVEGRFGGLTGTSQFLGQMPNLSPSVHMGNVSDVHGMFIEFDGTVDHGNSGGPLFDPNTGVVYGVIEGYVPGAPVDANGDLSISSAYANMATSRQIIADFLAGRTIASGSSTVAGLVRTNATARVFEIAAAHGDAEAESSLGLMYLDGTNGMQQSYAKAIYYFQLAVDQGNADGEANLGHMYYHGYGVPQDYTIALHWFQLSATQGNAFGRNGLGCIYARGLAGVSQSFSTALHYFELSAAQGNAYGEVNLGSMYNDGRGVPQDYVQALHYFQLSAAQGNADGEAMLGYEYDYGRGAPEDYVQALHYLQLSAAQGSATGEDGLGRMYFLGHAVPKDYATALHYFQLSATQGDSSGANDVGVAYSNGFGVPLDYATALHYFQISAAQGNEYGENNLGYMYENGYGVSQDYATALHWYELAVGHGDTAAAAAVQRVQALLNPPPP